MEPNQHVEPSRRVPSLKRELKGLVMLYVAFAVVSLLVATTCSGPSPH